MLKKGQKITQGGITILNNLGIDAVYIEDEYCFNHTANQSTMALSNIFEYIEGFKAIGHRINDGTSNGMLNYIGSVIIPNESALFRIS